MTGAIGAYPPPLLRQGKNRVLSENFLSQTKIFMVIFTTKLKILQERKEGK